MKPNTMAEDLATRQEIESQMQGLTFQDILTDLARYVMLSNVRCQLSWVGSACLLQQADLVGSILCSRFIINNSAQELGSMDRIFFQIEEAFVSLRVCCAPRTVAHWSIWPAPWLPFLAIPLQPLVLSRLCAPRQKRPARPQSAPVRRTPLSSLCPLRRLHIRPHQRVQRFSQIQDQRARPRRHSAQPQQK